MGNVLIRDSYIRNPKFDGLTWFEEALAVRLMTISDDGLVDKRPAVIKHLAYPTRDNVSTKAIESGLTKLVDAGILVPVENEENGIPSLMLSKDLIAQRKLPIMIINNNHDNDDDDVYYLNNNISSEERPDGIRDKRSTKYEDFTRNAEALASKDNPYGYYENQGNEASTSIADAGTQQPTVEAYVTQAISFGSPGQYEELQGYMEILSDELIKYAVDIACGGGFSKRNWNYVKGILRRWVGEGYKTVADVDAAEAARQAKKKAKKTGTDYSEMNYEDDW